MKLPPLLLGAALLFWGWQADALWLALAAALVLEAARWVPARLELEPDHYTRLWNLSTLIFIGLALYQFFTAGGYAAMTELMGQGNSGLRNESLRNVSNLALRTIQLAPAALLPFMFAFAYGPAERLPLSTFSLIYRARARREDSGHPPRFAMPQVRPAEAYLIVLLVSASATKTSPRYYFFAMAGLIAWTLWHWRPRGFASWVWPATLVLALAVAYSSQLGVVALQKAFELWQNRLFSELGQGTFDTTQTRTSLGRSGTMKQSGRIIWRVVPGQSNHPALLREAAFNQFEFERRSGAWTWTSLQRKFELVVDAERDPTWVLNSNAAPARLITVTGYTRNGEANVPQPAGTAVVTDRTATFAALQTNALGAARALGGSGLAVLELRYGTGPGWEAPPLPDDSSLKALSPADESALNQIAARLRLAELDDATALAQIRLFFFNHFTYSLDLQKPGGGSTNDTPLAAFLLDHRKGHCEYFATAATLLLRKAGIPARYAIGYALQEKRTESEFVARSRHAHAWALAWLNGRWIEVDCTPAGWFESEWAKAGPWETWGDWLSDAWLGFNRWRQGESQMRLYIFVVGVLALGFMAWRQVAGKQWRRARTGAHEGTGPDRLGDDSEFYQIERALVTFRPRDAAESMGAWLARLELLPPALRASLQELLALHYRHRFDPVGLSDNDRARLRDGTARWLADFRSSLVPLGTKK